MQFRLDTCGSVTARASGGAKAVAEQQGGAWLWEITDANGFDRACGAARDLEEALWDCARSEEPGCSSWCIDLPCGSRISRPGRLLLSKALANHGYAEASKAWITLHLVLAPPCGPRGARAALMPMLEPAERVRLEMPVLVSAANGFGSWTARLPVPAGRGYVQASALPDLARKAISPGAAALAAVKIVRWGVPRTPAPRRNQAANAA